MFFKNVGEIFVKCFDRKTYACQAAEKKLTMKQN